MGRTVLPYSQVMLQEQDRLKKFRRALRKEDQQALDALFEMARLHVQAGAYSATPDPFQPIVVSILIELQKSLNRLQNRAAELEQRIQVLEAQARDEQI